MAVAVTAALWGLAAVAGIPVAALPLPPVECRLVNMPDAVDAVRRDAVAVAEYLERSCHDSSVGSTRNRVQDVDIWNWLHERFRVGFCAARPPTQSTPCV